MVELLQKRLKSLPDVVKVKNPTGFGIHLTRNGNAHLEGVPVQARTLVALRYFWEQMGRFEAKIFVEFHRWGVLGTGAKIDGDSTRFRCARLPLNDLKYAPKRIDSVSSIPIMPVSCQGVISSAGRASALQAEGRRFDPVITHHSSRIRGASSNRGSLCIVYLER